MRYVVQVKVVFVATVDLIETDFQRAATYASERTLEQVMEVIKEKCETATGFSCYPTHVERVDV